jgi:hypothetical protein
MRKIRSLTTTKLAAMALAISAVAVPPARAMPFTESTAGANAFFFCLTSSSCPTGGRDNRDSGMVDGRTTETTSVGAPGAPDISATASSSADFGVLRASADAFAFSGVGAIDGRGSAAAIARATFGDVVNVESSVLAPGSPVHLEIIMTLSDSIRRAALAPFTDSSGHTTSAETLEANSEDPRVILIATIDGFASDFELANFLVTGESDARTQTIVIPFDTTVGGRFNVSEILSAGGPADETVLPNQQLVSMEANASDTGTLSIVSGTPGVTLIGDSGHNYAPSLVSIAEPTEVGLLATGLLALLGVRSRPRRR